MGNVHNAYHLVVDEPDVSLHITRNADYATKKESALNRVSERPTGTLRRCSISLSGASRRGSQMLLYPPRCPERRKRSDATDNGGDQQYSRQASRIRRAPSGWREYAWTRGKLKRRGRAGR